MKNLLYLLGLFIRREIRQWSHLLGLILLTWIVAYIVYRIIPAMDADLFNFVYWIFVLLISINATMRIESHNSPEEHMFFYHLAQPQEVFLAKWLFNTTYIFVVSSLFFLSLTLFFSEILGLSAAYFVVILLGSAAISSSMTLVTSLGFSSNGQNTLVSVLGLPLLIPTVLILSKAGSQIYNGLEVALVDIYSIFAIMLLSISASIFLYPIVWKQ